MKWKKKWYSFWNYKIIQKNYSLFKTLKKIYLWITKNK
jgi:hypothetical protein